MMMSFWYNLKSLMLLMGVQKDKVTLENSIGSFLKKHTI